MRWLAAALLCWAQAAVAATAEGRNWRISIESLACEGAERVGVGMHIAYLGPKGPVEAPVAQLVDAGGRRFAPKSLVWKGGSRDLARWLPSGGVENVQSAQLGEIELKFEAREASGALGLEFGDIPVFTISRKGCEGLLKPGQVHASRKGRKGGEAYKGRIYRAAYPCVARREARVVEANNPPYAPRHMLVFGRGYLPSARQVELPTGKVAAQSYGYFGADTLDALEQEGRRALGADFAEYRGGRYFAFNWGSQRSASGNELYSIGIYEMKPCAK